MTPRRRVLAVLQAMLVVVVIVVVDVAISGYVVFTHARVDALIHADAIVVLGGEHDGREDFGLSLARAGWADTVVLSNPYDDWDPVMKRVCRKPADVEVFCLRPDPLTTRGEAEMVRRLADQRSWHRIVVVSWQYHLPRARFIFDQCFSDQPGATVFTAVPRNYRYSLLGWELIYGYQWAGVAKAVVQGACS